MGFTVVLATQRRRVVVDQGVATQDAGGQMQGAGLQPLSVTHDSLHLTMATISSSRASIM